MALECALSFLGIRDSRLYNNSKVTRAKIFDLCCDEGMPLGVDDPSNQNNINNLLIDLPVISCSGLPVNVPQMISLVVLLS